MILTQRTRIIEIFYAQFLNRLRGRRCRMSIIRFSLKVKVLFLKKLGAVFLRRNFKTPS